MKYVTPEEFMKNPLLRARHTELMRGSLPSIWQGHAEDYVKDFHFRDPDAKARLEAIADYACLLRMTR